MNIQNPQSPLITGLKNANPRNILIHLDIDDCLDASTIRALSEEQKEILWDLHTLTGGGVILTTNSDGRSVFEMDGMAGYPVISEFATVMRNIPGNPTGKTVESDDHGNTVEYLHDRPSCRAAFNAAVEKACYLGVALTDDAKALNGETPVIKLEEKEMGIALVFGHHAELKEDAIKMAEYAFEAAGFSKDDFEIDKKGKDAVEIKVKGAAKADVVDHLANHPLYERDHKYAMGDSGSDFELMERLKGGITVGDALDKKDKGDMVHLKIGATKTDFSQSWDFLRDLRDSYKSQIRSVVFTTTRKAQGPK